MRSLKIVLAGATGAAGREVLRVLEEREVPVGELIALGSEQTAGQELEFRDGAVRVRKLAPEAFSGADVVFFTTPEAQARELAPLAAKAGAVVLDGSGAFADEADCPVLVAGLNGSALAMALRPGGRRIAASPRGAAVQLALTLAPLHAAAGLTSLTATTLEAVSGAGQKGIDELESQSRALFNLGEVTAARFPHRIAYNLIPGVGAAQDDGDSAAERALGADLRRVLDLPALTTSATCVRVPVFHCHSVAAVARFARPLLPDEARALLAKVPALKLVDDLAQDIYPMPLLGTGDDAVLVGRLRRDGADPLGLQLFVVADNLRAGLALNLVQLAEILLRSHSAALPSVQ